MGAPFPKIRKAVLPVAGLGTRVLPATKAIPKEMLPVVDRPVIQYVVDEAKEAGIEHIIFVTGRNKGAIEDYFDRAYELEATLQLKNKIQALRTLQAELPEAGTTSFVRQQSPLGLGHAIWCARDVIGDDPFAVLLPDVLVKNIRNAKGEMQKGGLAQLLDVYAQKGSNVLAVNEVDSNQVDQYGIVGLEGGATAKVGKINEIVEKPSRAGAPSCLSITGRYVFQPGILQGLQNLAPSVNGEVQLTEAIAQLMASQDFYSVQIDGDVYDCGSKIGYFEAICAYALTHSEIGARARAHINALARQ